MKDPISCVAISVRTTGAETARFVQGHTFSRVQVFPKVPDIIANDGYQIKLVKYFSFLKPSHVLQQDCRENKLHKTYGDDYGDIQTYTTICDTILASTPSAGITKNLAIRMTVAKQTFDLCCLIIREQQANCTPPQGGVGRYPNLYLRVL